jgi:hypothetical protein
MQIHTNVLVLVSVPKRGHLFPRRRAWQRCRKCPSLPEASLTSLGCNLIFCGFCTSGEKCFHVDSRTYEIFQKNSKRWVFLICKWPGRGGENFECAVNLEIFG